MNYKKIAKKLAKMEIRERAIALENLHTSLAINKWRIVYDYLMQIVIYGNK